MENRNLDSAKKKIELYRYLMKNGFEPLDKEKINQSGLKGFPIDKINDVLETYKNPNDKTLLKDWIFKIMDMKQHHRHEYFNTILAETMLKKAKSFPEDNDFRQVYTFLANILKGEFPDIENFNDRTMTILLMIIQDMQILSQGFPISHDEFASLLSKELNYPEQQSDSQSDDIMKTLLSLFKFQKIADFMNPLNISCESNKELMKRIPDSY